MGYDIQVRQGKEDSAMAGESSESIGSDDKCMAEPELVTVGQFIVKGTPGEQPTH